MLSYFQWNYINKAKVTVIDQVWWFWFQHIPNISLCSTIFDIIFPGSQVATLCHRHLWMSLKLAGTKYHIEKPVIKCIWHHFFSYTPSRLSRSQSRDSVVSRQYFETDWCKFLRFPVSCILPFLSCSSDDWGDNVMLVILLHHNVFIIALTLRTRGSWQLSSSARSSWAAVALSTIPLNCSSSWPSGTLCHSSVFIFSFLLGGFLVLFEVCIVLLYQIKRIDS